MLNNTVNPKEIWLNYFNSVLYEKGLITEKEYRKMNSLILQKCHSSKNK